MISWIWYDISRAICRGLFMEETEPGKYKVSKGSVAFWIAFLPAIYVWVKSFALTGVAADIGGNHYNILMLLTVYNLGKKVNDKVGQIFEKKIDASIQNVNNNEGTEE